MIDLYVVVYINESRRARRAVVDSAVCVSQIFLFVSKWCVLQRQRPAFDAHAKVRKSTLISHLPI